MRKASTCSATANRDGQRQVEGAGGRLTNVAPLESLLEVPVVAVLLNGVRSDDTHEVVVVQEPPDGKIAEGNATPSQTVKLEGAAQQAVQLLKVAETLVNTKSGERCSAASTSI